MKAIEERTGFISKRHAFGTLPFSNFLVSFCTTPSSYCVGYGSLIRPQLGPWIRFGIRIWIHPERPKYVKEKQLIEFMS
jgi:hypothetical protein